MQHENSRREREREIYIYMIYIIAANACFAACLAVVPHYVLLRFYLYLFMVVLSIATADADSRTTTIGAMLRVLLRPSSSDTNKCHTVFVDHEYQVFDDYCVGLAVLIPRPLGA